MQFEPKIVSFLCNWCAYGGADLAGVSRMQYPHNIRVIRVMCSGRVDPLFVVEAFLQGADGVFVGACHFGDCHYLEGNYHAEKKVKIAEKLIKQAGVEPQRLRFEQISASEGERFSKVIKEFTEQLDSLGPSPISGGNPDKDKLKGMLAAKRAIADFRLRSVLGKEIQLVEIGNVYGDKIPQEEFNEFLEATVNDEAIRNRILEIIRDEALSVKEISRVINTPSEKVLRHIVALRRKGLVALAKIDEHSPLYVSQLQEGGL